MTKKYKHIEPPYGFRDFYSNYPHGYSIYEALLEWVQQVNDLTDNVNGVNTQLTNMINFINTQLKEYSEAQLQEWLNDGTLEDLINVGIFNDLNIKLNTAIDSVNTITSNIVDITNTPTGYTSASVENEDNTLIIQTLLNNFNNIFIPDGVYLVSGTGLKLKSNTKITLSKNAVLKLIPNDLPNHKILDISNVENVEIVGGTLQGERFEHNGTAGEWGMGLDIRSGKNITIKDITLKDFWGDGVYVSGVYTNEYSENITLENVICDNNRRQGMSIISVIGLRIKNCVTQNTNGVNPSAGIDFEPNNNQQRLQDIVVEGLTSINNQYGISLWFQYLINSPHAVDITLNDLRTDNNNYDVRVSISDVAGGNEVRGKVTINNAILKNGKLGSVLITDYPYNMPTIEINKPYILNANVSAGTSQSVNNAIGLTRSSITLNTLPIGNIVINEPTIIKGVGAYQHAIGINDNGNGVENVEILNPKLVDIGVRSKLQKNGSVYIEDKYKQFLLDISAGSGSISNNVFNYHVTNKGTSTAKNVTLNETLSIGSVIRVEIETPMLVNIVPTNNEIIGGNGLGKTFSSSQLGAFVVLKKLNTTQWSIQDMQGVWTHQE